MADKKVTLKRVADTSGNTDNIYPTTSWDQIESKPTTFTPTAHEHDASDITSGTISTARLGSGTADSTTFLRGDNTWATVDVVSKQDLQNVYIYGKASGAITIGQAVQFAGVQGDHILIKAAVPSEINVEPTLMVGIAETTLANNEFGYFIVNGRLNLDTSTYTAGDLLYFASAGSTAGALTTTEPTDPNASIQLAVVSIDGVGNGEFLVRKTILTRHINEVLGLQGALDSKATPSDITTAINNLVASAPGALDTLDELAAALGDDANFSTTVTNSIAGKVSKSGDTMTGNLTIDKTAPKLFMSDDILTLGLASEVDGQLVNYGTNYNQLGSRNAAYPGSFFRIDVRDAAASEMFNVKYIPPNSTEQTVFKVSRTGDVVASGGLTTVGNVGIGTTTLTGKLDVLSSGQDILKLRHDAGSGGNWAINPYIVGINNAGLSFIDRKNSTTPFVISDGGNVGIGTTSPGAKLDVAGEVRINGNTAWHNGNFEPLVDNLDVLPTYSASDEDFIKYNTTERAVELQGSDSSFGAVWPAIKTQSGVSYRISFSMKASVAATSGVYFRPQEYDAELPDGKTHTAGSATHPEVQEATRQITNFLENSAISTSWKQHTYYYTPASSCVWFSLMFLNWTGLGTNSLFVKNLRVDAVQNDVEGRFVNASGDTMTGNLLVATGATESGIRFRNSTGDFVGRYSNYVSLFNQLNSATEIKLPDSGSATIGGNIIFHDGYHPNADKLTTARNIALTGDVTGNANFDGSANISITATVADDSHNHIISNVDGLQTALDGKLGTSAKAADSNLLDGIDSASFGMIQGPSDYAVGTLVTTNINYAVSSGESFQFEIEGKSYGERFPWMVRGQGYIYNDTIINEGIFDYSGNFNTGQFRAFNFNGQLCFWWPRSSYWNNYAVRVYSSSGGGLVTNRVISVTSADVPPGVTKIKYFSSRTAINSSTIGSQSVNYANSAGSTTGNAATATKLATARNIALTGDVTGNANFDGSANISITATVADDSHNHIISNVDGLQTALDGKQASGSYMTTSHPANNITSTHLYMANGDGFVWNDTTNVMYVRKDGTDLEVIDSGNIGSQSVNYATSAGNAGTLDNIDSAAFVRSDVADTIVGNHEFYGNDTNGNYNNAPIEVREVNLVTNTQSSAGYAPSIAWHWGGRVQTQMKLYSNGKLTLEGNHTGQVLTTTEGNAVSATNADTVDGYHAVAFVRNVYSEFLDSAFPAAPLTTSFTSWSKPTGMPAVTLEANSRYYIFAAGSYYTAATTTGIGISPTFSTVSGQIRGGQIFINQSTSTTAGTSEVTANWRTMSTSGGQTGNFALGTAGPTALPGNEFGFYGIVETSGSSTVLSMHIRSEVNGSEVRVNRIAITAMKLPT